VNNTYSLFSFVFKGYFPKELPPAFNTYLLAAHADTIIDELSKKSINSISSSPCVYSISKGELSRRFLEIPNPINFILLTKAICDNRQCIFEIINSSKYSESVPCENFDLSKRAYIPKSKSVKSFINSKLHKSLDKRYELKLDIANFYSNIYTHSLSWALLGKEKAKEIFHQGKSRWNSLADSGDQEALQYRIGDKIDELIRQCHDSQTIGISIGPDTSFIIAELILSRIDMKISEKFPNLIGSRYYDDYSFFLNDKDQLECLLRFIQKELYAYHLEINEKKVSIIEAPSSFYEEYVTNITTFKFESKRFMTYMHLFFNILWKFAQKEPTKEAQIFKYGLSTLLNLKLKIPDDCWTSFEDLLYKTAVVCPMILPTLCHFLDQHEPTHDSIKKMTEAVFQRHISMNQHCEVSWALWLCKRYNIDVSVDNLVSILEMNNDICSIIALDIIYNCQSELLGDPRIEKAIRTLNNSFSSDSFTSSNWLLTYECIAQGWASKDIPTNNSKNAFDILMNNNIKFYDINPKADYSSTEYITSIPEKVFPKQMEYDAKQKTQNILKAIEEQSFYQISSEHSQNVKSFDKEFCMKKIINFIETNNFSTNIFDKVLFTIFSGGTIDEDALVATYAPLIRISNLQ